MDGFLAVCMNVIVIFGAVSLVLAVILLIVLIVAAVKLVGMTSTIKTKVDQTAHIMNIVGGVAATPFVSLFGSRGGHTKKGKKNWFAR